MLSRLMTQLKNTFHQRTDDGERLLSAVELHKYPIDATADASPPTCNVPESDIPVLNGNFETCPHDLLSFDRLQRIAASLKLEKLSSYIDALRYFPQKRLRSQYVVLQDSEELACCDPVKMSSETLFRKGRTKGHSRRAKRHFASDAGSRSTFNWYFCSQPETAKDCPTLEFLRIHLAPSNVWL